jgi:hypothetical protein
MFQTIPESAGNLQFKIILGHLRASQSRYKHDRKFSYLFHILGKAGQTRRLFYKSEKNESKNRHFRSSVEMNINYKSWHIFYGIKMSN